MAQLKDLIVTGPARIIGTLYAQSASTDLAGLVKLGGGTTNFLRADGTWAAPPNDKGVTSVAASGSGGITISGSPITSTGTIAIGLNLSTAINGLGEGSSPATMNDYAVVQYAGGGTTTTTYHRRKLSNILTKDNIEAGLGYARGAANGVAPLNASSKIDSTYLPSYVDDVLEYTAKANFPATGEEGKIYVDKTTNLTWRWGGSAYIEISPSLALGTTASTAAKGNHTHSFTPAGTIAVQTAGSTNNTLKPVTAKTVVTSASFNTVITGGTTTDVPNISKKTVVTGVTPATVVTSVTKKTVVTGTSVANEVLSFTTGDSISSTTGASATVSTGDSVTVGTAIKAYTSLTTGAAGSATTGDSVTLGNAVTVKTGDAAYKFTGTAGTTGAPA